MVPFTDRLPSIKDSPSCWVSMQRASTELGQVWLNDIQLSIALRLPCCVHMMPLRFTVTTIARRQQTRSRGRRKDISRKYTMTKGWFSCDADVTSEGFTAAGFFWSVGYAISRNCMHHFTRAWNRSYTSSNNIIVALDINGTYRYIWMARL